MVNNMLDYGFYNMDCMDGMKEFPDKFFDLAIVDPPYGINITNYNMGLGGGGESLPTETGQQNRRFKTIRETRIGGAYVSPQNISLV